MKSIIDIFATEVGLINNLGVLVNSMAEKKFSEKHGGIVHDGGRHIPIGSVL